jgi:tyrosyl-tRNA synthetase
VKKASEQAKALRRGTSAIIPEEDLEPRLNLGRPLRVKFGVDPTAPDIHLGHTVPLTKLRQWQDLGHTAVLIIGDFTALIGDPSGRSATRPQLDEVSVRAAAATYEDQVYKVLRRDRLEVHFNSKWLGGMGAADVVRLGAQSTVARMLERDDFAKRYGEGVPIGVHEFLYPLFQAHDSVEVEADVEIGGTDQTFNLLLGRQLQKDAGQAPQLVFVLPLLEGTDGVQKMSKSLGNHIGVAEPAEEIFGKIMSISDDMMWRYYELLSGVEIAPLKSEVEAGRRHPMDVKKDLAETIARRFAGDEEGGAARRSFEQRFQARHIDPADLDEVTVSAVEGKVQILQVLRSAGLVASNSEARRLIKQRAVRIDGTTVSGEEVSCGDGHSALLEVGKRRAVRLRFGS